MDIERMGIGNVIWRHGSPLGGMHSIDTVISHICTVLATKCDKLTPKHRAYMMLIGNYGGHMAFAMDPPYCVAYAAEYKHTNDPSKMTFCEPSNHSFAMTASNMVVWQLLSVVNWNPAERKLATGGCLLILKGHAVWPQVVSWPSYAMQPCSPIDQFIHMPGGCILDGGAFWSHGFSVSWSSRGFGTLYCRGGGQAEGAWGFKPSQHNSIDNFCPHTFPSDSWLSYWQLTSDSWQIKSKCRDSSRGCIVP